MTAWIEAPARRSRSVAVFANRGQAQASYLWQSHGLFVPIVAAGMLAMTGVTLLVDILLPDVFPPARLHFLPAVEGYEWLDAFAAVQLYLMFLAGFLGTGNICRRGRTMSYEWLNYRPIAATAIVAAHARTALRSTLLSWGIVGLVWLLALTLPVSYAGHNMSLGGALVALATPRRAASVLLLAIAFILLTWRAMVDSLWWELNPRWTQRQWWAVFVGMAAFILTLAVSSHIPWQTVVRLLPDLAVAAAGLKLVVAMAAVGRVRRSGLVPSKMLGTAVGIWLVAAVVVSGIGIALVPKGVWPVWGVPALAILALPGARLALAVVAADEGRHP